MFRKIAVHAAIACVGLASLDAFAAETAQVNVSLQVTAGCQVYVGAPSASATPSQVTMDFGTMTTFGQGSVDNATVQAQTGSGAAGDPNVISVACGDTGTTLTPRLTLTSGLNDTGSTHQLASGTQRIAYTVHSDANRDAGSLIQNGDAIPLTGTAGGPGGGSSTAVLYGKVTAPEAVTTAGSYTDTLLLTLTY